MGCEDCKNYEPKAKEPSKDAMQILANALATVCKKRRCVDCNLSVGQLECPVYQTHELLERRGVMW